MTEETAVIVATVVRQVTLILHKLPADERADRERAILAKPGTVTFETHSIDGIEHTLIAYDATGLRLLFGTDEILPTEVH